MLNSNNEWSRLREVIVGDSFKLHSYQLDLSFKLFFNDNAYYFWHRDNEDNLLIKGQYIDELNEDLNGLVSTLESMGIKVHRPTPLKSIHKFQTPYWESVCVPALNVRDQAIVIGNEIIETPCCIRSRYFENDLLKPIYYK